MCVYIVCCAVLSHSVMSDSLRPHGPARLLCPWGFSRQEYWDGLSCPPPGNLPNPGIKPRSPALEVDSILSESPGKPTNTEMGSLSLLQGNLPDSGIKAGSPALLADSLPAELPGKPKNTRVGSLSLLQGNLPDPGIEEGSPAFQADSFPAEPPGKPPHPGTQHKSNPNSHC